MSGPCLRSGSSLIRSWSGPTVSVYFGVDLGQQLYYVQAPAYLFLLCVGAAFSLDRSGISLRNATRCHRRSSSSETRPTIEPEHPHRRCGGRRAGGSVCTSIAFATSASTMNAKDLSSQESAAARSYFTTLLGQVDRASSHGGDGGSSRLGRAWGVVSLSVCSVESSPLRSACGSAGRRRRPTPRSDVFCRQRWRPRANAVSEKVGHVSRSACR